MRKAFVLSISLLAVPYGTLGGASTPLNGNPKQPPGWNVRDFSGTYAQTAAASTCDQTTHSTAPALQITQSDMVMTLQVLSTGYVRTLRIERPESPVRYNSRNGVARWEGDDLVVTTKAPAFPLWGRFGAVAPGGSLTEKFVHTPEDLVYRTWLTPVQEGETLGPVDMRLFRCRSRRL